MLNMPLFYTNCVFLGGTYANSTWRADLISKLKDSVPYLAPQFPDWTPEDAKSEKGYRAPKKLIFATVGELPKNQFKGIGKIKRELLLPYTSTEYSSIRCFLFGYNYKFIFSKLIFPSFPVLKSSKIILEVFSSSTFPPEIIAPLFLPISCITSYMF